MRHRWIWRKPAPWLRTRRRRLRNREDRQIASIAAALESPDPDLDAKWEHFRAKMGLFSVVL